MKDIQTKLTIQLNRWKNKVIHIIKLVTALIRHIPRMTKLAAFKLSFPRIKKLPSLKWSISTTKLLSAFKWMCILVVISLFFVIGLGYGYITSLVIDDPIRNKEEILAQMGDHAMTGFVYYNDGSTIGQIRSGEDRRLTTIEEIPENVKDAFLAIEDNRFYTHYGIHIKGIFRALKQQVFNEDVQTGGSTITQQLARRVFLSLDKTQTRKAKEILLAMRLERIMSKDEILLAYLTHIPFGHGSSGSNLYGIKAAAVGIFDQEYLRELTIPQAAYLAGLPQLPSHYSAFTSKGEFDSSSFEQAMTRQKLVLKRMHDEHKITDQQYEQAVATDLHATLATTRQKAYDTHPFLMMEVERRAVEVLIKEKHRHAVKNNKPIAQNETEQMRKQLLTAGYKIYTTIDPILYEQFDLIAKNKQHFTTDDAEKGIEQIGAMMIDNHSGAILSMIGGRDYYSEQYNHATQMLRQPGSAMKPIAAYLPALEKGLIQPASIIDDVPLIMQDGTKGIHIAENWDHQFHGLITARTALEWSYNVPALYIFNHIVGIEQAWEFTRSLGITSLTEEDNMAQTGVIGGLRYGVSVEELTNAYSAIGNQGLFHDAYLIERIENAEGDTIYEHSLKPVRVFSEQTAYLMTDMMKSVVTSGTAADLPNYFEQADSTPYVGKTGSTQDDADAWFVGYTPDITVGVWAGYDKPVHKLTKQNCSESAGCGTQRAKRIWALLMDVGIMKRAELFASDAFERPEGLVSMSVSRYSGLLPTQEIIDNSDVVTDLFHQAYVPTETDHITGRGKYITYLGKDFLARPETPVDMVKEKFMVRRDKPIALLISEIRLAQGKQAEKERKPLSHYYPTDAHLDAPAEQDPRMDDGHHPSKPSGLEISKAENNNRVTFLLNREEDVVGYRLYRSVDGSPFAYVEGKPLASEAEAVFTNGDSPSQTYAYYVTAVDVGGNESQPSSLVFNDRDADFMIDFGSGDEDRKGIPSAPKDVSLQLKGAGLELKWKKNASKQEITSYQVYYSDEEQGTYRKMVQTNKNRYIHYAEKMQGWYRITAKNRHGESRPSTAVQYP